MSTALMLQEDSTNSSVKNTTGAHDWTEVYEAVRWIQLVMALLSVLGSGSIIICVLLQRLSRRPELQPLFLLSVSDLLLALCWLIGAAVYSTHCNSLNTHCYNLHTVEQVFVVKARRIYRRVVTSNGYLGNQQRTSFRVMDRRMLLYPLVFILCWGPAVGLAFLRVVKPLLCQGKALTSASQGFLNCLVYGWTHARLRQASRTVLSRDVDTQTPLLRSQKRSYQTLPNIS
ncbi:transmembrane protein 116-like protein [Lates japonicus]|uniref:Transmembrane protein 116-like protein n=1 Tax=Lates japonicus TaxID=270547 RepID=A0AAD3MNF4_LATJO|nr:transmembrane protein 116-like protein [Lates japonicus]